MCLTRFCFLVGSSYRNFPICRYDIPYNNNHNPCELESINLVFTYDTVADMKHLKSM